MRILVLAVLVSSVASVFLGLQQANTSSNHTKVVKTEVQSLEKLQDGLAMMKKLKSVFVNEKPHQDDGSQFANGALSEELAHPDSKIWSTIESMVGSTEKVVKQMKGKSKAEQKNLMDSLEHELDDKAVIMKNVTESTGVKQKQQNEEYLLGLLLLHAKDWSYERQLNATQNLMNGSPIIQEMYLHHVNNTGLATQLAALMDKAHSKTAVKASPKK